MTALQLGALPRLALLSVLCLLPFLPLLVAQSYVPQFPAFTAASCAAGQTFVQVGYPPSSASNATLFPDNAPGTTLGTYWGPFTPIYVYTTPFTSFLFGSVLHQITMALSDNSALLGPVAIRLGLFLFQSPDKNVFDFNFASLLGQTDVVTLYPSKAQTVYANLQTPVKLLDEGNYGIAIYANGPIFIVGGTRFSGFSALPDFGAFGYNDYQLPPAVEMYDGDKARPVGAVGCIDANAYHQPNTTFYAFCALVETYTREPKGNGNEYLTSMTNTTRYSGVIGVDSTQPIYNNNGLGVGYAITSMEGEVQQSTNAGGYIYPPLGIQAFPFRYSRNHSQYFPGASDILYPNNTVPLDAAGIVITTARNQTNLYRLTASNGGYANRTIGSTGQTGKVTTTYYSSFIVLPADPYLNEVITNCSYPIGSLYVPDVLTCASGSAAVQFGDVSTLDTDPLEEDEEYQYLPPNLLSFRYFQAFTPDTTAYQLTYYTYSNPEAIVHMRLGLFRTNTSYINSFSALPQFELLGMTHEVQLVNIEVGLVTANLSQPIALTVGQLYAIGVWTDALVYGPSAQWGVDAPGLEQPYTQIAQDGTMPSTVFAEGGQTTIQLMGVNACAANNGLAQVNFCATFAQYVLSFGQWYLVKRYYSGSLTVLTRPMHNDFGDFRVATAGNGSYGEVWWFVNNPVSPNSSIGAVVQTLNGTWNLNNFQTQSPNYIYDAATSRTGLLLDEQGMQVIVNVANDYDNVVYATIINAQRPRGSPEWFYQEAQEYDYYDDYTPIGNTAAVFLTAASAGALPTCDVGYVPWNAISPSSRPFIVTCTGLAQIQSTYGDNRIFDYNPTEGNMIQANTVYTQQFTVQANTVLDQISLDVLNNVNLTQFVQAQFGIYDATNALVAYAAFVMLEIQDQMIVVDIPPVAVAQTGVYRVAFTVSVPFAVATSNRTSQIMTTTDFGLPGTFASSGSAPAIPLTAYGCVSATHYFCASFQYYQGDNYSPVTYDYLYQGLVKTQDVADQSNSYGTYKPIAYAVGHLTLYARIARYAFQFMLGFTDLLLDRPGGGTGDDVYNVLYSQSNNQQPLDGKGIRFLLSDDFGYGFSLFYNTSSGKYQDSTNAELGTELLTTMTLKPIDYAVGVPQCSWLDLPSVISPNVTADYGCDNNAAAVMWGDDVTDDYFYNAEGLYANDFNLIVLSPFNTGPTDPSTVNQLALALNQNGNVFAHIRMALYHADGRLLAATNEVAVDNARDGVLYFKLEREVVLAPAAVYYAAYWSDVAFYSTAGQDWNAAQCYYNLTQGYDRQDWPSTVGGQEAEYYLCYPLPVAALGCSTPNAVVPPEPPVCPPVNNGTGEVDDGRRYSVVTVTMVGFLALVLGVICTLLGVKVYNAGNCPSFLGFGNSNSGAGPLSSRGDDASTTSSRYSSLQDE